MANFAWLKATALNRGQPFTAYLSLTNVQFGTASNPTVDSYIFCGGKKNDCSLGSLCAMTPDPSKWDNGSPKSTPVEAWCAAGRAGATAVHIPKANASSGRMAPTPKLAAAGVNIALATDTQHGDMVELMRWALVTARLQRGGVDTDWQPSRVFEMATMGGARALGLQDELGSLALGKKADFVAFDFRRPHLVPRVNLVGTLVHNAQGRDVDVVAVDGELLVRDGRPTRVDLDEVCAQAEQASRELWGGVGKHYWKD